MIRNTYRMPFAQWVYFMAREEIGAHGRILAIHAALFGITGNDVLCSITGLSPSTLDKWKRTLSQRGWVIVTPGGGRGLGAKVDPAYHNTPVTFTDVSPRDHEKFRAIYDEKRPLEKHPLEDETPSVNTTLYHETSPAKPPVSTETSPAETGVIPPARALIETPSGLLSLEKQKVKGREVYTPQPPEKPKLGRLEALEAFESYNAVALRCGIPQATKMTGDRERKILARLRDYGLDGWHRALANIEKSAFLRGLTDSSNFRADLEFVCQAKSFSRLHDGGYGNGAHAEPKESEPEKILRLVQQDSDNQQRRLP